MAQTITLHGGPWHGQVRAVEDDRDHFHILGMMEPITGTFELPADMRKREGMYSRIHNSKTEFEWDGWRSHD